MKYRELGATGVKVSEIGFGAWAIGGSWGAQKEDDSLAALRRATELGVNLIDTAAGYGEGKSERIIAKFRQAQEKPLFVATKIHPIAGAWPPSPYDSMDTSYPPEYVRRSVEKRLENLEVSCIDLLQLHTWTRAWNRKPDTLELLRKLKAEGKIRFIGISTPEQDQNSLIDLMRAGFLDVVQVIYNLFEQEPAAEFLDVAAEHGVGVIVRVPFDEGSLTGKYTAETHFPKDDFRHSYFMGDRLRRTVTRVQRIAQDLQGSGYSLPQAALRFCLAHPAVSTVIPGMRNASQAEANCDVSDLPDLPPELLAKLRRHQWRRSIWYPGNE